MVFPRHEVILAPLAAGLKAWRDRAAGGRARLSGKALVEILAAFNGFLFLPSADFVLQASGLMILADITLPLVREFLVLLLALLHTPLGALRG
jgi:hypothetical protein